MHLNHVDILFSCEIYKNEKNICFICSFNFLFILTGYANDMQTNLGKGLHSKDGKIVSSTCH